MNIASSLKTVKSVITANSPVLLVGTAIAGVVATGVLAAKGGYNARGIVDEAEANRTEPLTVPEKVQLTWLCYAAPALTGASTIAATVGVHTIHTKRHAALAGLYAVTTTKLDDYREKAEELLGTKKAQELNNEIAQRNIDREIERGNDFIDHEVIITDNGDALCYDEWSGRYFMGSVNKIESAVNEVNRLLIDNGDASLNDFYDYVGLTPISMGTRFGWSGEKIEARFGTVKTTDGRPAISFWFHKEPKDNLGRA